MRSPLDPRHTSRPASSGLKRSIRHAFVQLPLVCGREPTSSARRPASKGTAALDCPQSLIDVWFILGLSGGCRMPVSSSLLLVHYAHHLWPFDCRLGCPQLVRGPDSARAPEAPRTRSRLVGSSSLPAGVWTSYHLAKRRRWLFNLRPSKYLHSRARSLHGHRFELLGVASFGALLRLLVCGWGVLGMCGARRRSRGVGELYVFLRIRILRDLRTLWAWAIPRRGP